jgi:hypothetical protein
MTTLRSSLVHTRKPHRCTGCFEQLLVKDLAHIWVGLCEGEFQSNYFCLSCLMFINSSLNENEWLQGEIRSEKREIAPEQFEEERS